MAFAAKQSRICWGSPSRCRIRRGAAARAPRLFLLLSYHHCCFGANQLCHRSKKHYNSRQKHLPSLQQAQDVGALLPPLLTVEVAQGCGEAMHVGHHQRVGDVTLFHLPKSVQQRCLRSERIQDMLGKAPAAAGCGGGAAARAPPLFLLHAVLSFITVVSE